MDYAAEQEKRRSKAAVGEIARLTDWRIELDEGEKEAINQRLMPVQERLPGPIKVNITYFVPDKKKVGGTHISVSGTVKKIDNYERVVVLRDRTNISINDILCVDGEIFDGRDRRRYLSYTVKENIAVLKFLCYNILKKCMLRGACKTQTNYMKKPIQRWISFAGSGLVTHSLKPYFEVIWANDISEQKTQVYTHNHDESHFHLADINVLIGSELPVVDLSWASFSCQDLSLVGYGEEILAKRGGLVWQWLHIMEIMGCFSDILVTENVEGGGYFKR